MRDDPQRFATFVVGTFMLVFYGVVAFQTVRVWKGIGRCPILWGDDRRERLRALAGFTWPLIVLAWAHCPECFRFLPSLRILENWPVRLLGVLCLSAGAALQATAYAELGHHWRIGVDPSQPPHLVRTGIYASVRHPVFTALWLMSLGIFLLAPNILFAVLWALGGSILAVQAEHEERFLERTLGDGYRRYKASTGKFFPLVY